LLERAIGDVGHGVEERRSAAERALSVLSRIPEHATRELYIQGAARRLDVSSEALADDLARVGSGTPARPRVTVRAPATESASESSERTTPAAPLSTWEEYIATYVVQRPALAHLFLVGLDLHPEELQNDSVRR